ncbi:MAG: zinc-binding dehydrogenase [Thermoanaerobaculia bacterium]|nr:zinc-binding dehydrogenase [Thermoanaerobaculia bacterium]
MKGFRVARHGGPDALEWGEWADPVPGPGKVTVRVRACALNHLDLWLRNGVPGHRFPLPLVPGSEVAGDVATTGAGVDDLPAGTPCLLSSGVSCGVCARCLAGLDHLCPKYGLLGEHRDGGYAEYVTVPRRNVLPIPKGLSYVEAAAIPLGFLTAWHMLVARAALAANEDILLHAAGSGVTSAGIQIARLLGARRILVTAGTEAKLARASELGATHGILYNQGDFVRAAREATQGEGVDVVFDHVGGETFERSLRLLKRGGRMVLCGATSGAEARINLRALFFKQLSILGSTMGSLAELHSLLPYFETGALRPVVDRTFTLAEAPAAQEYLAQRGAFGKIVLTVGTGAREVPRPLPPPHPPHPKEIRT